MSTMYRISQCASATRSLHVKSIFETGEGRGSAKRRRGVGDRRKTTSRRGQGRRATPAHLEVELRAERRGVRSDVYPRDVHFGHGDEGGSRKRGGARVPNASDDGLPRHCFFRAKEFSGSAVASGGHPVAESSPQRRHTSERERRGQARTRALARGRRVGLASHTLSARLGAFVRPAAPARVPSAPRAELRPPRSPAFLSAPPLRPVFRHASP